MAAGTTVIAAMGLGWAGTASADAPGTPGETPIFAPLGGAANTISTLGPFLPAIAAGSTGSAANWAIGVNDNPAAVGLTTWTTGDTLTIDVTPVGGQTHQDTSVGSYIEFSGTPVVLVTGGASGATAPTVTTALGTNPADNSNDKNSGLTDQLTITFTNSAGPTGLTNYTLLVAGIKYTVGAGTAMGPIHAFGTYTHASVGVPITVNPNAAVADIYATANTPPVAVLPGAVNAPISPITITEVDPGIVQSDPVVGDTLLNSVGYVCVSALSGKFTGAPTITVGPSSSGGTAAVNPVVSIITPSTSDPNNPLAGLSTLVFQVLASSTTTPTVFTLSNLTVNAPTATGPVGAYVTIDNNSSCDDDAGTTAVVIPGNPVFGLSTSGLPQVTIYTVATGHGPGSDAPIFGSDAAQTAVASMEYQFPVTPGGQCITNNANPRSHHIGSTAVVTDDLPGGLDGLTSAALAGYLGSGVLFTNYGSATISPYTMSAIAQEGFTSVDIVGGNIAVPDAAETQLANTPSYYCGGSIERTGADGNVLNLQVHRIGGIDAATTAEDVANVVNSGGPVVGQIDTSGSYSGGWNQTLGTQSASSPNLPLRTAFLVTNQSAADASAASAESYAMGIPILVTEGVDNLGTPAETGLLDLGVSNVIIVGGNLAVDNNVSSTLQSQGYNVLRLAGTDLTQTSVDVAEWALDTDTTSAGQPLGLGWGDLQFPNECLTIQDAGIASNPGSDVYSCDVTVGLATGDPALGFEDAESSSTVDGNEFIPLLLSQNASSLGQYVTAFLNAGGSPFGVDSPFNPTDPFVPWQGEITDTILPFGGPIALQASTIQAALNAVSAGANPS